MTRHGAAGIAIGFCGIALVLGPGVLAASSASLTGFAAMLLVATGYATGATYGRWARPPDPAGTALGQQVVSVIVSGALALATGQGIAPLGDARTALSIAALGSVATAMPMVLYWRLLARAPTATAGFVDYLIPLWTTLIAVTVLGERPQPTALAGGALVLAGIAVATGRLGGRLFRREAG
jgi:drug/metabolite transporter (DMT)-like permease